MVTVETRAMKPQPSAPDHFLKVLAGDYCIGCGACAAVEGSPVRVELNAIGCYTAKAPDSLSESIMGRLSSVCPFTGAGPDEWAFGRVLFPEAPRASREFGPYEEIFAGHVVENGYRVAGSSGGLGKWVLAEMLARGLVDHVVQVAESSGGVLYRYKGFSSAESVIAGSRSVYYPVEMSGVLRHIRETPGRYAVTGVPCFIKAVRLLQKEDPVFRERIVFAVGLICGQLKSTAYADAMAWQCGVSPGALTGVDFRLKPDPASAKVKGFAWRAAGDAGLQGPVASSSLFGTEFSQGFFQPKACDYCDDVVGETADVSVGDAWLPRFIRDGRGTSLVVVRHKVVAELIRAARNEGRVSLEALSEKEAFESQAGGFRHRREGLSYRLYLDQQAGRWTPPKRMKPRNLTIHPSRKKIYAHRILMTAESHRAWAEAVRKGSFAVFKARMEPLVKTYRWLYRPSFFHRIKRGIQRRLGSG